MSKSRIAIIVVVVVAVVTFGIFQMKGKATPKVEVGRTVKAKTGTISLTVSESGTLEPVTQN